MTNIEFRLFFESLPDQEASVKEINGPIKSTFAKECGIPLSYLKEMAIGKRTFTTVMISRILPVMHKYGFQGN